MGKSAKIYSLTLFLNNPVNCTLLQRVVSQVLNRLTLLENQTVFIVYNDKNLHNNEVYALFYMFVFELGKLNKIYEQFWFFGFLEIKTLG